MLLVRSDDCSRGGFSPQKAAHALALCLGAVMLAATAQAGPTPEQEARIRKLQQDLLAPCCYSEPVSRHNSDIAMKMRAEISTQVIEGRSDREILDAYKQQYGLRVLAEPEGAKWWWEHIVPWTVLAFGALIVVLVLRHWMRTRPAVAPGGALAPLPDDLDD